MKIKLQLTLMSFLQFFIWGSWLISLGGYLMNKLNFSGSEVGGVYSTMGVAALFMPGLLGILADKWINAERLLGICHLLGGCVLIWASTVTDSSSMYWIMLLNMMVYMPTLALSNTVSYNALENSGLDLVKDFPPIRVWGTVGFICAMWIVDLLGWSLHPMQFYVAAVAAFSLGLYSFILPKCPPSRQTENKSIVTALGLDAFVLFKQPKMLIFFIFTMLLGAALQITNTFGEPFLHDFDNNPLYSDTFAVKHPGILMSVSQISETLFILTIPFFLRRFGIKKVMLISMAAWFFRFGLFGVGNPGSGMVLLVLSMIIYGMAFDFFNISGSLFVEIESSPKMRASAQGLFMIMTNGLGAIIGSKASGWLVDYFTVDGVRNWPHIWFSFAAYSLVIGIIFAIVFKYKHDPKALEDFHH